MILTVPVITVDGPSSAGKSTLCRTIAQIFKWNFLNSGIIYRILALAALYYHIDLFCEDKLALLASHLNFNFVHTKKNLKIIFEKKDISNKIHTQKIESIASQVAVFPRVRESLLYCQRAFRKAPGLIADGRDMGTVVFPDAAVKIFLDASPEERANRRFLQLKKNGFNVSLKDLLSEIKIRDDRDRKRVISPLIPAKDALILNSTDLTIEQELEKALQYVRKKFKFV